MIKFHKPSIFEHQISIRILFQCLIPAIFTIVATSSSAQTWHTVRWVNDGDTVVLSNGQRVRYIGINAPEIDHENQKAQPYGYLAGEMNRNLIGSKRVRLEYDIDLRDRYGRMLAYLFLDDGTFVNARLLENGLAYYLFRKPNLKHSEVLLKAQQKAMDSKKGMWRNWGEKDALYIGNRESRRFHNVSCSFAKKIKSKNRIQFSTKWSAFQRGFAPAKECIGEFWSYGSEN